MSTRAGAAAQEQPHSVSQRDLRLRSKEIMDAVEAGQSFAVTRDGREIGELVPLRRTRRFVPRADFFFDSPGMPSIDLERFRADQQAALDDQPADPFARHG